MKIDMKTGPVRSIAGKSKGVAELVQPGVTELSDGWLPTSEPAFKSTLLLCRQKWIFTMVDLREATREIGDKLNASANAVDSADTDSADQF